MYVDKTNGSARVMASLGLLLLVLYSGCCRCRDWDVIRMLRDFYEATATTITQGRTEDIWMHPSVNAAARLDLKHQHAEIFSRLTTT